MRVRVPPPAPDTSATADRFATVHGSAGARARLAGLLMAIWPVPLAAALCGYLLRAAFPVPALAPAATGVLMLILALAFAVALLVSRRRLEAFLKGARGEERVAHELAFLPGDYTVFHGLPARGGALTRGGGADADHIVVGPTGCFVIETKNWRDEVTIEDGEVRYAGNIPSRPPLEQVKQAAHAIARILPDPRPPVHPVVCFTGDAFRRPPQGVMGVMVCNVRDLISLLTGDFGTPLDSRATDQLSAALRSQHAATHQ